MYVGRKKSERIKVQAEMFLDDLRGSADKVCIPIVRAHTTRNDK
jgi:hypothetical protein